MIGLFMYNSPEKLSDINPEDDPFTAEEIIEARKFKSKIIEQAAKNGNYFAAQSLILDMECRRMGIDPDYVEDMDDEDGWMY